MGNDSKFVLESQRRLARSILVTLVASIVAFVLFASGPNLAFSIAQQQTTSPSGYQIKWMNPDEETSPEISGKDDNTSATSENDTTYHLVAWVNELPPGYSVTFQYHNEDNPAPTTLPDPTLVGDDTFELYWQVPADEDSAGEVIAILQSNGTQVSEDREAVTVNNATDDDVPIRDFTEDQAETVEIVDPANGDGLGFYDRPGGDVVYAASIVVQHSADTEDLIPYYSVSSPGTDPDWIECENGTETADDASDGVRCELAPENNPTQVTAVAVVASDSPPPGPGPDIDGADAHRVTGYVSDPSSVTLSGTPTGSVAPQTCTSVITATVFDQNGSRVVGVDTDVHALGPDNTLAFDDDDDEDYNKAPENHPTETARDCEAESPETPQPSGTQGWHESGTADTKHVEAFEGTADDGTFSFRLYSGTAGSTQFTVWADEDANDRLCSNEAQADGSIGWGEAPAAATGVTPDETSCPSPTGTGTATPTSGPTTQSPTPTNTSPTPDPTGTETPGPDKERIVVPSSVTIDYDRNRFNGSVSATKAKCQRFRKVVLFKVRKGQDPKVGNDRTARAGNYSILKKDARGNYYVKVRPKRVETRNAILICRGDRSPRERVR